MKRHSFLWIVAIVLTATQCWAAGIISLNLSENSSNQIFAGGQMIGPLKTDSTYWNSTDNPDSGSLAAGTKAGLINDAGLDTGVNVTWNSSNTYWNADGTGDDEHRLSVGYLDDGNSGAGNGVEVTFENIPYAHYRVYGLTASDNNGQYTTRNTQVNGQWVYGGDNSTTVQAYGAINNNFDSNGEYWTRIIPDEVIGNYWVIDTAGSTLSIICQPRNGSQRASFTGVIIEEIDNYSPIELLPANGIEVGLDQTISWGQFPEVANTGVTYSVYFGSDPNTWASTLVKTTSADPADFNYAPVGMTNSTTYFWRIDANEPNEGSPIIHTGATMQFSTEPASARIEKDPVSTTVAMGADAVLTVVDLNGQNYQWYKGQTPLDDAGDTMYLGENTDTLTVLDVQLEDEGYYHCVVDNSLNQPATSNEARLLTQRLAGWWKLDGDFFDAVNQEIAGVPTHDGTAVDPNNFVAIGKDGGALNLPGEVEDLVIISDSAEYFNFYPQGYTVSAWVKRPENLSGSWGAYVSKQGTDPTSGFILTHSGDGRAIHTMRQSWNDLWAGVDDQVDDDTWHLVTGTYDPATATGRVYLDGIMRNEVVEVAVPNPNEADLMFGAEYPSGEVAFIGQLDDVKIWTYSRSAIDIANDYLNFNPGDTVCVEFPMYDIAGPEGVGPEFRDCVVNLYDIMPIAASWLECNEVPTCIH